MYKRQGYTFDYIISNPPFGIDWKREAADVEKEHKLGDAGRFGVGLPQKSDGQMLFLLNGIAKLKAVSYTHLAKSKTAWNRRSWKANCTICKGWLTVSRRIYWWN